MGGRTLRAAGEHAGVDHSTIQAILQGRTWADLDTISRLEYGFDAALWPPYVASMETPTDEPSA
jgi:hypothetical protein